jgi:hypothetical protein
MGKQKLSGGDAVVGSLSAKKHVSAGSQGFSIASCAFVAIRQALSAGTTGVRSYGAILPADFIVLDCYVDVRTREQTASAKAISIGDTAASNSFLSVVSTASLGPVAGSLAAGAITLGANLAEGSAASGRFKKPYLVLGSAATVTSQVSEVQTEFAGDVVFIGLKI